MSAHNLNQRQLLFCEHLLNGASQAEAYRKAGYKAKRPDAEASKLANEPSVSQYLREKRGKLEAKGERTREKMVDFLWRIVEVQGEEIDREKHSDLINGVRLKEQGTELIIPDKLAAAAQLTKLMGWNEPEKVDVGFSGIAELLGRLRK